MSHRLRHTDKILESLEQKQILRSICCTEEILYRNGLHKPRWKRAQVRYQQNDGTTTATLKAFRKKWLQGHISNFNEAVKSDLAWQFAGPDIVLHPHLHWQFPGLDIVLHTHLHWQFPGLLRSSHKNSSRTVGLDWNVELHPPYITSRLKHWTSESQQILSSTVCQKKKRR